MAALRNDYAVHTAEASKRKRHRGPGRRPLPGAARRSLSIKTGLTELEYRAVQNFMEAHGLYVEAGAVRQMVIDRLKADGFLTADGKLPPKPSHD